jgi:hypothetical protein
MKHIIASAELAGGGEAKGSVSGAYKLFTESWIANWVAAGLSLAVAKVVSMLLAAEVVTTGVVKGDTLTAFEAVPAPAAFTALSMIFNELSVE